MLVKYFEPVGPARHIGECIDVIPDQLMVELYDACKAEPDLEERHKLVHEAVRIHIDEGPFYIGTCAALPVLVVVKHNLRNVPETGILGPWAVGQPGAWFPEQFSFADGANDGEYEVARTGGSAS